MLGVEEQRALGVGVCVDEAGADDEAGGVDDAGGVGGGEVADGGDGVAGHAHVGAVGQSAGAVDDGAA